VWNKERTSVVRFSSFSENCWVWVLECIERPDPVLFKKNIFIFQRPGDGFKNLQKIISPGFQSAGSHISYNSRFSKVVFKYWILFETRRAGTTTFGNE
jgi:hypothetical protein